MTFDEAVTRIRNAQTRTDLIGTDDPKKAYRALAKLVHPDCAPPGRHDEAAEAFAKLSALWASKTTIATKAGGYTVGAQVGRDDIADYFLTSPGPEQVIKIVARPTDNDLMRREADNLQRVRAFAGAKLSPYLPELVNSFPYREPTGTDRHINVFTHMPNLYSLATVVEVFPGGLDGRHVAWIWRRLLVALGLAHKAGVVHGAVVPDHVLIEPDQHGLVLVNWCLSAGPGQRIPAIVKRWRDWYPPNFAATRGTAHPAVDVGMASVLMLTLLDNDAPPPLRQFAKHCVAAPSEKPWRLLSDLDKVLETVYGARTFTPFPALPAGVTEWPRSKGGPHHG